VSAQQLARTIRDARANSGDEGVSLRGLRAQTGLAISYLSRLERGQVRHPSPDALRRVAAALDLPYTRLMREAGYL
jgi:HTH-type transcriptional regulator, competence development regulator